MRPFFTLPERNARLLFLGQLVSQVCEKCMSVGLLWILARDHSARWISWYIAIGALPHLLLAPFSARWVSRLGPLRTVIVSDLCRGVLLLAAAGLSWLWPWTDANRTLFLLLVLNFASNLAGAFFNPAILSLPVHLAKGGALARLNALIDSSFSMGNILGPLLSIAIFSSTGLPGLIAVNGASFVIAAWMSSGIRMTPEAGSEPHDSADALRESGISRLLRKDPVLLRMMSTFLLMNLVLAPLMMLIPWSAQHWFGGNLGALAAMETALGIGSVAGGVVLSVLHLPGSPGPRIAPALTALGAAFLAWAFSRDLALSCLLLLTLGFFLSLANVNILSFLQDRPNRAEIPRVMALVNLISVATLPVSMGTLGLWMDRIPVAAMAVTAAVAGLLLGLSVFFIPGVKHDPAH